MVLLLQIIVPGSVENDRTTERERERQVLMTTFCGKIVQGGSILVLFD
jgi:hypothetical protein